MSYKIKESIKYAAKFLIAVSAALAVALVTLSDNAITTAEWIQIALAFLGAIGVYTVPNKSSK